MKIYYVKYREMKHLQQSWIQKTSLFLICLAEQTKRRGSDHDGDRKYELMMENYIE